MKQRIAIDMDEVMAFTVQKIVDRYEDTFGYHLSDADLAGKIRLRSGEADADSRRAGRAGRCSAKAARSTLADLASES